MINLPRWGYVDSNYCLGQVARGQNCLGMGGSAYAHSSEIIYRSEISISVFTGLCVGVIHHRGYNTVQCSQIPKHIANNSKEQFVVVISG